MGNVFASLLDFLGMRKKKILVLGFPGVGKTSLLHAFKLGHVLSFVPTIGLQVESTLGGNLEIISWDLDSTNTNMKCRYNNFLNTADALIYVIDVSSSFYVERGLKQLNVLLSEIPLSSIPLLVIGNKADVINGITWAQFRKILEDSRFLNERRWNVIHTTANNTKQLHHAIQWLQDQIS